MFIIEYVKNKKHVQKINIHLYCTAQEKGSLKYWYSSSQVFFYTNIEHIVFNVSSPDT